MKIGSPLWNAEMKIIRLNTRLGVARSREREPLVARLEMQLADARKKAIRLAHVEGVAPMDERAERFVYPHVAPAS